MHVFFGVWLVLFSLNPMNAHSSVSPENLEKITSELSELYAPVVLNSRGWNLKFEFDASIGSFGRAEIQGKNALIQFQKNLADNSFVTPDVFAFIICHELGHFIGGVPAEETDFEGTRVIVTLEGQADYFASLKCMKNYLKNKNNRSFLTDERVPGLVKSECKKSYSKENDLAVCLRTAMTGFDFMKLLATRDSYPFDLRFESPDPFIMEDHEVPFTGYPEDQCRLDTIFAGALCPASVSVSMSYQNYSQGSCQNDRERTRRPRCWFNPRQDFVVRD